MDRGGGIARSDQDPIADDRVVGDGGSVDPEAPRHLGRGLAGLAGDDVALTFLDGDAGGEKVRARKLEELWELIVAVRRPAELDEGERQRHDAA